MAIRHPPASATAGPAGTVFAGTVVGEVVVARAVVLVLADAEDVGAPAAVVVESSFLSEHPPASKSTTPAITIACRARRGMGSDGSGTACGR
jgi:hypothetical protein